MAKIKIKHIYTYNDQHILGSGMAVVYEGKNSYGEAVAIKKIPLDELREPTIAKKISKYNYENLVPILDVFQDDKFNYIVMPICETNLDKYILDNPELTWEEGLKIILDILNGLKEFTGFIHRDLKPKNILYNEGKWKIADFGLSRDSSHTTSMKTFKHGGTEEYASPEQWRNEPSNDRTDIYALGGIIHFIFTKKPPFVEDYYYNHLNTKPDTIKVISAEKNSFVLRMLNKPYNSRPSITDCIDFFSGRRIKPNSKIQELINEVNKKEYENNLDDISNLHETKEFEQIKIAGDNILDSLLQDLFSNIKFNFPGAEINNTKSINYKNSTLRLLQYSQRFNENQRNNNKLICSAIIEVNYGSISRSSSLIYMKSNDNYDWYEVSFYSPLVRSSLKEPPYALTTDELNDSLIFNKITSSVSIAHEPREPIKITGENKNDFIERWTYLFFQAVNENFEKLQLPYNILTFYK